MYLPSHGLFHQESFVRINSAHATIWDLFRVRKDIQAFDNNPVIFQVSAIRAGSVAWKMFENIRHMNSSIVRLLSPECSITS